MSGGGPYRNLDLKAYYQRKGNYGMHSEVGTATFTSYDSFKKFMPAANAWPPNEMWNQHFLGTQAGNAGPDGYNTSISLRYGRVAGIEDYCRKAQLLNLETMKTLYESWLDHSDNTAAGVLIWMSQSAYPSFVWQTYDYYFDTTGAYWGAKNACEPVHIYWNQLDDRIRVVNTSGKAAPGLTAEASIYNADGTQKFTRSAPVSSTPDAVADCFPLTFPEGLSPVHFIKLKLRDAKGADRVGKLLLARHDRPSGTPSLKNLPPVKLAVTSSLRHENGTETMTADITNPAGSRTVALGHPAEGRQARHGRAGAPGLHERRLLLARCPARPSTSPSSMTARAPAGRMPHWRWSVGITTPSQARRRRTRRIWRSPGR